MKVRNNRHDVISGMFMSAAVAMMITELVNVAAHMIDGIITSNFYGADAYSAISLASPIVHVVAMLAGFISMGAQIICSQCIGRGERDNANGAFSLAMIHAAALSVIFLAIGILFPDTLAHICGVTKADHAEIYDQMLDYFKGYLVGVPVLVFIQVMSPLIVIDGRKKLVATSAIVLCVTDVIGDLLNVLVFDGHNFGMGIATSASYWVQYIILLLHFVRGKSGFRFGLKHIHPRYMWPMVKGGLPTFVNRFATILRDLFINRFNLFVSLSVAAIAARSIQNDLNSLTFTVGKGIGKVLVTMTGMYYSAGDKRGLKRLFDYAMRSAILLATGMGVVLFVCAPLVVSIFTREPDVMKLAVLSVRCMSIAMIFDAASTAMEHYLQGIQNLKMVTFMNLAERFFVPVISALVLGLLFGSTGILISIASGKVLMVIIMFVIIIIRNKRFPKGIVDFMFLPDEFGGDEEDSMNFSIRDMLDVMNTQRDVRDFCINHGFSMLLTERIALYIEEMGGNIVHHGTPKGRKGLRAEIMVQATDGKICLTLRDYCQAFDPVKYYAEHENDEDGSLLGIAMVMKTAEKVSYVNAFDSNNTIILTGDPKEGPVEEA